MGHASPFCPALASGCPRVDPAILSKLARKLVSERATGSPSTCPGPSPKRPYFASITIVTSSFCFALSVTLLERDELALPVQAVTSYRPGPK